MQYIEFTGMIVLSCWRKISYDYVDIKIQRGYEYGSITTQFLRRKYSIFKDNGLYNEIDSIEGANGPEITINGKQYINLSSNNYLGLATNEDLKSAAKHAIDSHGVGAGAVRSINGTLDLHDELERDFS